MSDLHNMGIRSSQRGGVGTFLLGIIFCLIFLFFIVGRTGSNQSIPPTMSQDSTVGLINSPVSALQPDGELAEMFNYGSNSTDLQRQLKLKQIIGKVVDWRLPVYEVKQSGNEYLIQTSASPGGDIFSVISGVKMVKTFLHITPRDERDKRFIENLKTGDFVRVKGVIEDTTMRTLDIRPAILVKDTPSGISTTSREPGGSMSSKSNTDQNPNQPDRPEAGTKLEVLDTTTDLDNVPPNPIVGMKASKVAALVTASLKGVENDVQSIVDEIKRFPKTEHGDRKTARRLNNEGLVDLRKENYAAAIQLLSQARDADLGDVEVRENLAYGQMKSRLLDESELTLMTVLGDAPDRASAWGTLGQVFVLRDNEEQAIACMLTAYKYSRNQKRTIEAYQRLVDSDPDVRVQSAAKKALDRLQVKPIEDIQSPTS